MKKSRIASVSTLLLAAPAAVLLGVACSDSTSADAPMFSAPLSGAEEVPPRTTTATGSTALTDNTTSIDYTLNVTGITGVTAAHIHVGPVGANGPVIQNLFIPVGATGAVTGTLATGRITNNSSATVSLDSLRKLFKNGNAYVNVHTVTNQGGEIRGQIK